MREWTDENDAEIMKGNIPTFDTEFAYALEAFEDENDRKPNEEELKALKAKTVDKIDSMLEAYQEYKASGAFKCVVCEKTHYHHAPKDCRDAYNSDHF